MIRLVSLFCVAVVARAAGKAPPHIIFIISDDQGWNDIGYNNPAVITPNIDALAKGGVVMTDYAVYKVCSPTRATIMTGFFPHHHGVNNVLHATGALPASFRWFPQELRDAGYETHMVGKHHMGYFDSKYLPTWRGFDTYFGYLNGAEDYWDHTVKDCDKNGSNAGGNTLDLLNCTGDGDFKKACAPAPQHKGVYSTDLFTQEMLRLIRGRDTTKPFYLLASFQNVHESISAHDWQISRCAAAGSPRATMCGDLLALDGAVGNLTQELHKQGMIDNSIIVYSTDNGGNLHGGGNNFPLRGGKFNFWEGGTRGVAWVNSPLIPVEARGKTSVALAHAADWYATLLGAAGLPGPAEGVAMDSVSLWPIITGASTDQPRTQLVHAVSMKKNHPVTGKIRSGRWNLYVGDPGCESGWPTPSHPEPSKHSGCGNCTKMPCLFDIIADVGEHHDVAAANPDLVANLTAELTAAHCSECLMDTTDSDGECEQYAAFGAVSPWLASGITLVSV